MTWVRGQLRPVRARHPRRPIADGADKVLTSLYQDHYRSLVRLAVLLVHDLGTAEEISQAAFAQVSVQCRRLNGHAARMARLRQILIRQARTARRHLPPPDREDPRLGHLAAYALLRSLPDRQREALALRYYANVPEAEAAVAMGVTRRALRRHTARALAAARDNPAIRGPLPQPPRHIRRGSRQAGIA